MLLTYGVRMSRAADVSSQPNVPARGLRTRTLALRRRVRQLPGGFLIWRIGITIVGVLVVAIGVVLLPLPGPGWLIIFGGLGILATEYQWAARLLQRTRRFVRRWTTWGATRRRSVQVAISVAGIGFVLAVIFGGWYLYGLL
jgi:uncharacterized protein (TIGR02611 family)